MNNIKDAILKIIENQVNDEKLTVDGKKILKVISIQFTSYRRPLDKSVFQIGNDSIYYEDTITGRNVNAEYSCRIIEEGPEDSSFETNGSGSFHGEYDIEANGFKEDTCSVVLRSTFMKL